MRRSAGRRSEWPPAQPVLSARIPMTSLIQMLTVAEYLNFRHAAAALGISQSSVSARIRALEEELGVQLFERNTRGVRLTAAGRHFTERVRVSIDQLDHAVKTVGMIACGEQGALRIGVHALLPGGFLDLLLERFSREYNNIRLHIVEGTARDTQIQVREGNLDIAFAGGTYELPDLHTRAIWRDRVMVVLPATHSLAEGQDVVWSQLAKETFLVRCGGNGQQVQDLIAARSEGRWSMPAILRLNVGRVSLLSMIARGHGISLFAEENAAIAPPGVVFLPVRDELEPVALSAVWSPSNRNPALKNLLHLAAELNRGSSRTDPASRPAILNSREAVRPICTP